MQQQQWRKHETEKLDSLFRKNGVDYTNIATNSDFVKPLIGLFARR